MAALSAVLFWLAWPTHPLTPLLFVFFVPVLAIEDHYAESDTKRAGLKSFLWIYLAFLLGNLLTTWWVAYATLGGAIAMLIFNSLFMALVVQCYRFTKKRLGEKQGLIALVFYWLGFEYLHLNWELSWPWLTLGNGFAMHPAWVQWYEYTGALGGSLWILLINIFVYRMYKRRRDGSAIPRQTMLACALLVLAPLGLSFTMYLGYQEKGEPVNTVVIQPNIDPYTEKFVGTEKFIPFKEQIRRFIKLSEEKMTDSTLFVLWPETAIDKGINESQPLAYSEIQQILAFKRRHPNMSLLTGVTSHIIYGKKPKSTTSRFQKKVGYYDVFNTGLFIGPDEKPIFYHKSKLVPGAESVPFPKVLGWILKSIDLGGTLGGYGKQDERTVFEGAQFGIAPSICYESIYGDFTGRFVDNGAQMICIITNDAWWRNTDGHRQHFQYARLRAVETRRPVARSANTGISGFIDQRGDVLQRSEFWTQTSMAGTVMASSEKTYYVKHGDILGRIAAGFALLMLLFAFVRKKTL
ncbi:apolipoprotein N-acyltransferase [Fulvitalea axinellae]|uniref:Apolipoprotein N-acyltransferase n=2 Tax=Fulvitalea axinellae TaxID=1182444 RepID=A0AAU9CI19_9BACT|nr:apolipoprotein N-acyltransferase [Fulvitalea axinellae]